MAVFEFTVPEEHSGKTLYQFLKFENGIPSRMIIRLKKYPEGLQINGEHARTIDPVSTGDKITLNVIETAKEIQQSDKPVEILFENSDVIVFGKPFGMACHTAKNHQQDTLENVFAKLMADREEVATFRCVNRLDKDTSGAVLVAKTALATHRLRGNVFKKYTGIITGHFENDEGRIDLPIYRPDENRTERCVDERGQRSVTNYKVIKKFEDYSLVDFVLETGRTHQIRVHCSHLGHPLIGDDMYGGSRELIGRQCLHCSELKFINPSNMNEIVVKSNIFYDMDRLLIW